ncbi:MAG: hypothetical protein ACRBB0_16645 [Pelagimonas sp.]|uniref:hypothetical protein n=1 Tax=Pelagimonas sp. TaxID=2073170 RepID=UPI003D6A6CFC
MLDHLSTTTALTIALMSATGALADSTVTPVGVMGLFHSDSPTAITLDRTALAALGCSVRRSGIIGAAQGDIGLEQPNQFALLACDTSVLSDRSSRAHLAALAPSSDTLAVLEGDLIDFPVQAAKGPISDRQYVFKISYYNNQDVNARDAELARIDAKAETLEDTYVTESFVGVDYALGMPTPDEVVILYYDDAETGDRFRNANSDFLSEIGVFNATHLISTIYYVGQAGPKTDG